MYKLVKHKLGNRQDVNRPSSSSSPEYHTRYYQFEGVNSCWDVIHMYRLMWASVVLNVISLFLGIITAAILGAYKDMVSRRKSQARGKTSVQ